MSSECTLNPRIKTLLLWSDHYYLTRQVIVAAVHQLSCLQQNLNSLYDNQRALGVNFTELTCCKKAGTELTAELIVHINIAVQIVTAAINNQPTDVLYASWLQNANRIAAIYHRHNRCIKLVEITHHMIMHLETTLQEAVAVIQKDCEASETAGATALTQIQEMALYIARAFD